MKERRRLNAIGNSPSVASAPSAPSEQDRRETSFECTAIVGWTSFTARSKRKDPKHPTKTWRQSVNGTERVICSTAGRGTAPTNTGYLSTGTPKQARLHQLPPMASRRTLSPATETSTRWVQSTMPSKMQNTTTTFSVIDHRFVLI